MIDQETKAFLLRQFIADTKTVIWQLENKALAESEINGLLLLTAARATYLKTALYGES